MQNAECRMRNEEETGARGIATTFGSPGVLLLLLVLSSGGPHRALAGDCSACKGTLASPCTECSGKGTRQVHRKAGLVKRPDGFYERVSGGWVDVPCKACSGRGGRLCPSCGGFGRDRSGIAPAVWATGQELSRNLSRLLSGAGGQRAAGALRRLPAAARQLRSVEGLRPAYGDAGALRSALGPSVFRNPGPASMVETRWRAAAHFVKLRFVVNLAIEQSRTAGAWRALLGLAAGASSGPFAAAGAAGLGRKDGRGRRVEIAGTFLRVRRLEGFDGVLRLRIAESPALTLLVLGPDARETLAGVNLWSGRPDRLDRFVAAYPFRKVNDAALELRGGKKLTARGWFRHDPASAVPAALIVWDLEGPGGAAAAGPSRPAGKTGEAIASRKPPRRRPPVQPAGRSLLELGRELHRAWRKARDLSRGLTPERDEIRKLLDRARERLEAALKIDAGNLYLEDILDQVTKLRRRFG